MTTEKPRIVSPTWLRQPAHEGKPHPDELVKYKAYFRLQIERGCISSVEGQNLNMFNHGPCKNRDTQAYQVLRYLYHNTDVKFDDVAQALSISRESVRRMLYTLQERGLTEISKNVDHGKYERYSLWRLTKKGIESTEQYVLTR